MLGAALPRGDNPAQGHLHLQLRVGVQLGHRQEPAGVAQTAGAGGQLPGRPGRGSRALRQQ